MLNTDGFLSPIRMSDFERFPQFFSNVLKMALIPQIILNKRSIEEVASLVKRNMLSPEDADQIMLIPQAISNATMLGGRPSFNQLTIWCRVLWDWHRSEQYREVCIKYNKPQVSFTEEHVRSLFALAGFVSSAIGLAQAVAFADAYNAVARKMLVE